MSRRLSRSEDRVVYEGCLYAHKTWQCDPTLMSCNFNKPGSMIALGQSDGKISVLQPSSASALYMLEAHQSGKLPVTSVQFLDRYTSHKEKENVLLATYSSGYSCLWHVTTRQLLSHRIEERQSLACAVSPECKTFATTGSDAAVIVYDAATHDVLTRLESSLTSNQMDGHMNRTFSVKYHPTDGNFLISAGWDQTVQFWDLRKKHSIRRIFGPHVCGDCLSINPSNMNIATGSWRLRDTIQIWDFHSGKLLQGLQPELNIKAYALRWSSEKHLMVGGSQLNKVSVIDTQRDLITGCMMEVSHGVYALDYSPAQKYVGVVAGHHLYLSTWKRDKEDYVKN